MTFSSPMISSKEPYRFGQGQGYVRTRKPESIEQRVHRTQEEALKAGVRITSMAQDLARGGFSGSFKHGQD